MFSPGTVYLRRHIHELFGGQRQGGISTPAEHKVIFIFTSESGKQYGYSDGWTEAGIFLYTGEGQLGDMTFSRGNAGIRDHLHLGKDIHLFEAQKKKYVRYIGQVMYQGHQLRRGPDRNGEMRQIIVFELAPVGEYFSS